MSDKTLAEIRVLIVEPSRFRTAFHAPEVSESADYPGLPPAIRAI